MGVYAIGDVHGCLPTLKKMCEYLALGSQDRIYFLGDLVGKGGDSWGVVDFVRKLQGSHIILGNHDLTFLKDYYEHYRAQILTDTRMRAYQALRKGSLAAWHANTDTLMVHAGIWPGWTLKDTLEYAAEVERILRDDVLCAEYFFENFWGNECKWCTEQVGWKRVRAIINILTRMRMLNEKGEMNFSYTEGLPDGYKQGRPITLGALELWPWFSIDRQLTCRRIVFGHWARLAGASGNDNIINLDGGCVYGGELLALDCETGNRYCVQRVER